MKRISSILIFSLLSILISACGAENDKSVLNKASPQAAPPSDQGNTVGMQGSIAIVDPKTGKLTSTPPAEETAAPAIFESRQAVSETGHLEEQLTDGSTRVKGPFIRGLQAETADGKTTINHSQQNVTAE